MNFKKKVSGSWTDIPHYIHKTATDTVTTPADIYVNGTTATVGLKGNTLQSSIPSPTSPVMPQGTGERTGNLFDKSVTALNAYPAANGTISSSPNTRTAYCVCEPNTTYTISKIASKRFIVAYTETMPAIGENYYGNITDNEATEITITTGADASYLIVFYYHASYDTLTEIEIKDSIMVVEGSTTPSSYIPNGYKIPISSNSTTTPVYLGEAETTRKIRKYEFTGQESIVADLVYSRFFFTLNDSLIIGVRKTPAFCTHWQVIDDGRPIADVPNNALYSDSGNSRWFIKTTDYTTADDFKAYLAQQYAAGTPVTVWYVLAEPTTGIVNEPLRKIGDYADEVSNISIPVTAGADTLSVDTTLQPSEVTVNYKGWHPVQSVHERESGQWD